MGFEGIIRYIGEVEGKPGEFAGVELDKGFVGKGKNDGTYQGSVDYSLKHTQQIQAHFDLSL